MSGHPRRGRPGPFHRRLLPIVAVLCVVMTTGACNPLDVLHYLAGCKDGSSSSSSASSSTVASTAKGNGRSSSARPRARSNACGPTT